MQRVIDEIIHSLDGMQKRAIKLDRGQDSKLRSLADNLGIDVWDVLNKADERYDVDLNGLYDAVIKAIHTHIKEKDII